VKRVVAVLASAVLLAAGCDRNPVFLRLSADYYPVSAIGSVWEYSGGGRRNQDSTVVDQVIVIRDHSQLQSGAGYDYWINEDGLLEHYEDEGALQRYEVPVYQAWVTYLKALADA
jgi:hypothetical protein